MNPLWRARRSADMASLLQRDGGWDLLIIGGGISGAGIALEAARRGLSVLLAEQKDFAYGSSSRSSKLVHGGLRYLKQGQWQLTRASVRERDQLLKQAAGLVEPQSFAFASYTGRPPGRWLMALGLALYDRFAGQSARHFYASDEFLMLSPHIAGDQLQGGLCYTDAKTDDARLVLRILQEAQQFGALACNYLKAEQLIEHGGQIGGAVLRDQLSGQSMPVQARLVVNASGAWADQWAAEADSRYRLRPLRGSHLLFPHWRLPVAQAISLMHPRDGRPVFLYPWEGATLVGTTDVDHHADLNHEACISADEVNYLMQALQLQFPQLALSPADVLSSYAGVRPVLSGGAADPSDESRDHAIRSKHGMIHVCGGKLTTFRLMALEVLQLAGRLQPGRFANAARDLPGEPLLKPVRAEHGGAELAYSQRRRLFGRYGNAAAELLAQAAPAQLQLIPGTETLWAELAWAAGNEAVVRLEDLLLRRSRIGLLLRHGGRDWLPAIRQLCQPLLGWSDTEWELQQQAYLQLIQQHYSLPAEFALTPDQQETPEPLEPQKQPDMSGVPH